MIEDIQKSESEKRLSAVNKNRNRKKNISKGGKGIMVLFGRSRQAQDALEIANANLKNASRSTQDRKQALKYCKEARKELERIKIPVSLTYLDQIVAAYREHGRVLDKLGLGDDAVISYNRANELEQTIPGTRSSTPASPVVPIAGQLPSNSQSTGDQGRSSSPVSSGVPSTSQPVPQSLANTTKTIPAQNQQLVPAGIFAKDFHPQLFKGTPPKPDDDLTDTRQLAYCLALLQASPSPDDSLNELTRTWLHNTKANQDEQERLRNMATDLLLEFMHDKLKDEKTTAEIVCIAPVLEPNNFRSLLGHFIASLNRSPLLHVHVLEGLDRVIQCANPDSMDPDDLIKILEYVMLCLKGTYTQSLDHIYRLTRTISHILDAMADGDIKDLDRVKLRAPLLLYSEELMRNTDPYMVFQAAYAYQALERVPDEERSWQTILRRTGTVVKGGGRLFNAIKGIDVAEFINTVQTGFEDASPYLRRINDAYKDVNALRKSGQGFFEALKTSFSGKRVWYEMLRGIDTLLLNGELTKVKAMICNAPCRRELAFQWGVCQRLGNLAADPVWDYDSRQGAIDFMGEIYRNDDVWGQEEKVKLCILDILMQLDSTAGSTKQAAQQLLQEFENNSDVGKQALFDAYRKKGPSPHLWKVALPLLSSSPLLDRVQKTPNVETDLRKFARVRLEVLGDTIYIAPEAKAHRQAADDDLFDLTTKTKEFLGSNRKVLLIWGDSGAGKSTFNKELERELWDDYMNCADRISRKEKKIPIFIYLPANNKVEPDFIGRQLRDAGFNEMQIKELKTNREFVLICDGYDEYQQTSNLYNINQLNQPGQWKAQMVISCRSEYFSDDYRYFFRPKDRPGQKGDVLLQEAVIAPFSKERIQAYIEKYVDKNAPQWGAKDYLRVFDQVPSLQELVTNPFLLTLTLEILPDMTDFGENMAFVEVTRVMLYDRFLDYWVDQGKERLIKRVLDLDDKRAFEKISLYSFSVKAIQFVKELAVAIFKNQDGAPVVLYLSDPETDTWKETYFGLDSDNKLLREACPLRRVGNLHQFIHQSVLEYGLARAIFEPRQRGHETASPARKQSEHQGVEKELSTTAMPVPDVNSPLYWKSFVNRPVVLQFLADRVPQEPVFRQQLRMFIEYSKTDKKWCTAAANAITILIRAGVTFNGKDLKGIQIPGADLSGGVFDYAQLQGADLQNTKLCSIWLRQADLSNAQMSGVQFGEWPYLKEENPVFSQAYSPDGHTCTVALGDYTINVYDTTTWTKIHTLHGHTDLVFSVAYSPSGHQIASGSKDKTVRLWDAQTGAPGLILNGHSSWIHSVTYSPSGHQIVSGVRDKTVRLWDAQTGAPGPILSDHTGVISSVAHSPKGHQIASGSWDMTIRLWDAQTGTPGLVLRGHTDSVESVIYSPSGHQIASGSSDKTVRLWDAHTGTPSLIFNGHSHRVTSVTYSPSGHQIASGSADATVRLWDAQTGAPGPTLRGHKSIVESVSYSPSGRQIASGSFDETVRLWDTQAGAPGPTLRGHMHTVKSVSYSPSGHQIVSGSWDTTVRLWDAQTGAPGPILSGHARVVASVMFSPSGRQIASGGWDGTVRLWDAQTGASGLILRGHSKGVNSISYSPGGHQIASGGWDMTVRLWDTQTGTPGLILRGHTNRVCSVSYSPSGHQIASGGWDDTVRLWDAQTGAPGPILQGHTNYVKSVTYSPSGHQIASGSFDGTVRLWDAQTGGPGSILRGHTSTVESVSYSPSGHQIASGGQDANVRLWDVDSGQCLIVVEGFHQGVSSVVWNATHAGAYLATGCGNSVITWKVMEEEDCH